MRQPAPLRFVTLVVGGWIGLRFVVLTAGWWNADASAPDAPAPLAAAFPAPSTPPREELALATEPPATGPSTLSLLIGDRHPVSMPPLWRPASPIVTNGWAPPLATFIRPRTSAVDPQPGLATIPRSPQPAFQPSPHPDVSRHGTGRLSAYAWLFLRDDGGASLVPDGTLGGSQAGLRVSYRIAGSPRAPLSLSTRLYAPLNRLDGAEAAFGLDWQPTATLPVHLLAERRERLGRAGRSDFGLTIYGGFEHRRGRLRLAAYGQAGVVGLEHTDLFADGAARVTGRLGPVEAGVGAWGGAQPGVSRLDLGPTISADFSIGKVSFRAAADWRFRLAGAAAPASGPALTLSTGF